MLEEFIVEDEDDDWLEKIKENDESYKDFYNEKITNIELNYIYINRRNNIEYIKKNKCIINENKLSKERLLYLLKTNIKRENKKYGLLSILQYNINLKPEEITNYIEDSSNYNFLNTKREINDILWEDTINIFQDINKLYIVFYEKKITNKNTKKVYIKNNIKQRRKKQTKKLI
tara:strand:- start:1734 stop:2255 length:522 start_codon:yes stop_codon:yes gene_type:complete